MMVAPMEQLLTMIFLLTIFAAVFLQACAYTRSLFQLNVSAIHGIGGVLRGQLGGVLE